MGTNKVSVHRDRHPHALHHPSSLSNRDVKGVSNTRVANREYVSENIKFSFTFIAAHRLTIQHLASTLHFTITENFLDCSPSVVPPNLNPSETVQLLVTVARRSHIVSCRVTNIGLG